jgi:23S rRNA pseudouridine1911/1915/1917 synthase
MNHKAKRRQSSWRYAYVTEDQPAEEIARSRRDASNSEKAEARPVLSSFQGLLAFEIDDATAGQRFDRVLTLAAEQAGALLSRSRIKALIEEGQARIGGVVALDTSVKLKLGEKIELEVPPPVDPVPQGEKIDLTIVYEDAHLLVIDKPAGLVVHPAAGHDSGTLVNALIAHCGASLSGIGGVKRPGIVHRIDKDTSGLLVVAKTDAAHQGLAALFADHGRNLSLTREYKAFVWNAPRLSSGTVDAPLGRHATHREKIAVVEPPRGREAITHWMMEERFGSGPEPVASLVSCQLETGRTHQIRVHMAHIGHPLLADPLYATGFRTKARRLALATQELLGSLDRQALHAAVLGFEHPVTGEELCFESALPPDLAALHAALQEEA